MTDKTDHARLEWLEADREAFIKSEPAGTPEDLIDFFWPYTDELCALRAKLLLKEIESNGQ